MASNYPCRSQSEARRFVITQLCKDRIGMLAKQRRRAAMLHWCVGKRDAAPAQLDLAPARMVKR